MTKVLVRSTDSPEQLSQLESLLRTEGEEVIRITEEEPLSSATQQDAADRVIWFISEQADPADGLFNVVIANDEAGVTGADMLIQTDHFSPSGLIDEVRARFDVNEDVPLLVMTDGYLMGTSDMLRFVPGRANHEPADPDGVLTLWRSRLESVSNPGDGATDANQSGSATETEDSDSEDDHLAIPRINLGPGW